jgi:uncharacterized protein YjbJ (UPF0337 family)
LVRSSTTLRMAEEGQDEKVTGKVKKKVGQIEKVIGK